MGEPWPLVGRHDEIELLLAALERTDRSAMVLAGAAGVGKSRLAAEVVARARSAGWQTLTAIGTADASHIPFGAFAHLISADLPPESGRLAVLRHLSTALTTRAGGDRLLLHVDDAHLLDASSAALVHQLVRGRGAFVLATLRTGEPAPESVVSLGKDGLAPRLELQPLSEGELEELVTGVLGGPVTAPTLRELARITQGNALFLHDLVTTGLEDGRLAQEQGLWRWNGPTAPSGGLMAVVAHRLQRLNRAERELVELTSLGEPLSLAVLERAASAPARRALGSCELLFQTTDGQRLAVRVLHPLYAEAVRFGMAPLRARELRGALADALEAIGGRRHDDTLRLAAWRLEAGQQPSLEVALTAGRRALLLFDSPLAEALARSAIAAGGGFAATGILAESLVSQGRFDQAAEALATLAALAATDEERARAAILRSVNLTWGQGRPEKAEEVLHDAACEIREPTWLAELDAFHATTILSTAADIDELIAATQRVIDRPEASPMAIAQSLIVAAMGTTVAGDFSRADRYIEAGIRLAREHDFPLTEIQLTVARWLGLALRGRLQEAVSLAAAAYREASEQRSRVLQLTASETAVHLMVLAGRAESALGMARETDADLDRGHLWGHRARLLGLMGTAAAMLGDFAAADAMLTEAGGLPRPVAPLMSYSLDIGRAWVQAAAGDLAAARRSALRAADLMRAGGLRMMEVLALHLVARFGDASEVAGRLAGVAGLVEGDLGPACAAHAAALRDGDGHGLDRVSAAFEEMGMRLDAAEAAAQAAAAHQSAGRLGRARSARTRAHLLLASCEGARTPALAGLAGHEALTAREHQVALLASGGMASADIARQLRLSVRTVNNQLQTVFSKLDVHSRRELAGAMAPVPAGLPPLPGQRRARP